MLIGADRLFNQPSKISSCSTETEKENDGMGFERILKASEVRSSSKPVKESNDVDSDMVLDQERGPKEDDHLSDLLAFMENKQVSSSRLILPGFMKDDSSQDPIGPLTSLDASDNGEPDGDLCASCKTDTEALPSSPSGSRDFARRLLSQLTGWDLSRSLPGARPALDIERVSPDGVAGVIGSSETNLVDVSTLAIDEALVRDRALVGDKAFDDALVGDKPLNEDLAGDEAISAGFEVESSSVSQVIDVLSVGDLEAPNGGGQVLSSIVSPGILPVLERSLPITETVSDQVESRYAVRNPYFALSFTPDLEKKEEAGSKPILGDVVKIEGLDASASSEIRPIEMTAFSKNAKEDLFSANPNPFSREIPAELEAKREGGGSFDSSLSLSTTDKEGLKGKFSNIINEFVGNTTTDFRPLLSSTPGLPAPEFLPQRGAGSLSHGLVNVVNFLQSNGELKAQVIVDPPSLGRIEVQIHAVPGGSLEASFTVESVAIKDMIKAQVPLLQDLLAQQGISLSQMSVDVRTGDGQRQRWEGNKGLKRGRFSSEGLDIDALGEVAPLARIDLEQGILMWIA